MPWLWGLFDLVLACTAPSPRGVKAEVVAAAARELGCDDVATFDTVEAACRRALELAPEGVDAQLFQVDLHRRDLDHAAADLLLARLLEADSDSRGPL